MLTNPTREETKHTHLSELLLLRFIRATHDLSSCDENPDLGGGIKKEKDERAGDDLTSWYSCRHIRCRSIKPVRECGLVPSPRDPLPLIGDAATGLFVVRGRNHCPRVAYLKYYSKWL
jgi:hypothetical protein